MLVSDAIIKFLEDKGINTIFSLSGGMISNLEDSIFRNRKTKLVSVKHEQAWWFAAEWFARVSWQTGVAMWTSWPWATNLITSIASSYFDSTPVLYITWQVNTNELTQNTNNRQTWFQETDIISMVKKITKYAYQIQNIEEIPHILQKAYNIMHNWRKWPVLIDIPMNMQKWEIDYQNHTNTDMPNIQSSISEENISDIITEIVKRTQWKNRPILLIGGGIKISWCKKELNQFSLKYNIPVVSSLMWLDSYDHTLKNYIWMIWTYGNRYANITLANADIVFVLWSRLDIRQTGAQKDNFCRKAEIIHVDIDEYELGYTVKHTWVKIHMGLKDFFEEIAKHSLTINWANRLAKLVKIKELLPTYTQKHDSKYWDPNYITEKISQYAPSDTIFINDVGQNQMRTSQSLVLKDTQQLLNCGWMWAMGFSLPAAIGAYFAQSTACIVSFNGDGWVQLNLQELETISYHHIPIIIIVYNNSTLGMIREFQDTYLEWRHIGTILWYSCPNLEKIAFAFNLEYKKIDIHSNLDEVFQEILSSKRSKAIIVEIICSQKSIVIPKIMFWSPIDNQWPYLSESQKETINNILDS